MDMEQAADDSTAALISRGLRRFLAEAGWASLSEVRLPNNRRADVMALDRSGNFSIIEIKSSLADFRADNKWPEYREHCDRLYFAVMDNFPDEVLPEDCGLIRADGYSAVILREAPEHKLVAARRKALTLRFARLAASRLHLVEDPWMAGRTWPESF